MFIFYKRFSRALKNVTATGMNFPQDYIVRLISGRINTARENTREIHILVIV
jgi:hypothetical protein